jgi:short-subunit dehydrogenase
LQEPKLGGKVAVITGASMGIGEAIAKVFAENDARVVLLSRDSGRAEAARERIGFAGQTMALACDVRNREEIDRVIGLTLHHFQRIDIWVNNAGRGIWTSLAGVNMADAREAFETNLFGTLEAMKAVVPIMKQQGGGAVINISSVAGHIPLPFHSIYSGTKFAMTAIGKAARLELAGSGINVLTVCPGYVRGITADQVARATLEGYLKNKREVVVPWSMHPVIKLYQLFPGIVEFGMKRSLKNRT